MSAIQAESDIAEIERLLGEAGEEAAHATKEIPSITADPAVAEAARRQLEIVRELQGAEAELAELIGDGEGRPGLVSRKWRSDPEAALVHLQASQMAGDPKASEKMVALSRYLELRKRLPLLRAARDVAAATWADACDLARRKLQPVGRDIFVPAARAAMRAYLKAVVQMHGAMELFDRLDAAGVAGGLNGCPFKHGLPPNATRGAGLYHRLIQLSRDGYVRWSDIEGAAPELIKRGFLTDADKRQFSNG